jgi:hypothetical protein
VKLSSTAHGLIVLVLISPSSEPPSSLRGVVAVGSLFFAFLIIPPLVHLHDLPSARTKPVLLSTRTTAPCPLWPIVRAAAVTMTMIMHYCEERHKVKKME